ncbi:MAG: EamA family transporter [Candidatus Hodarchaeales archaeon]
MSTAILAIALSIRIILLGFERIFLKLLGMDSTEDKSLAITTIFFGFGTLSLVPFAITRIEITRMMIFPVISSIFYSFAFWMYTASLKKGDVSLVTPLYNFNLIFLLIFSTLFLGEEITFLKIMGVFSIFLGLSYLNKGSSFQNSIKQVLTDKSAQLMIGASLLMAIGRILDGFASVDYFPSEVYAFLIYLFITIILFSMLAFRGQTDDLNYVLKTNPIISIVSGVTNAFSYLTLIISINYLDVSLVEPIGALNIFLAMILARILFQEDITQRLIAATLIVLGVFFILIPIVF